MRTGRSNLIREELKSHRIKYKFAPKCVTKIDHKSVFSLFSPVFVVFFVSRETKLSGNFSNLKFSMAAKI